MEPTSSRSFSAHPLGTYVVFACCSRCSMNCCISSCMTENRCHTRPQDGCHGDWETAKGLRIAWFTTGATWHGVRFLSRLHLNLIQFRTQLGWCSHLCCAWRGGGVEKGSVLVGKHMESLNIDGSSNGSDTSDLGLPLRW